MGASRRRRVARRFGIGRRSDDALLDACEVEHDRGDVDLADVDLAHDVRHAELCDDEVMTWVQPKGNVEDARRDGHAVDRKRQLARVGRPANVETNSADAPPELTV